MPQDELEKVMAYYESLKEPKQNQPRQPPPQVSESRKPTSSRQLNSSTPQSHQAVERREPIRPKETAGGIIYGSSQNLEGKPPSRYSEVRLLGFS